MELKIEDLNNKILADEEIMDEKIGEKVHEVTKSTFRQIKEELTVELNQNLSLKIQEECDKLADKSLDQPKMLKELTMEVSDRDRRRNNMIIFRLPESKKENEEARAKDDTDRSNSIMEIVNGGLITIKAKKIIRLGTYDQTKTRPLLVSLDSHSDKEKIMANTAKLKNTAHKDISIGHDLTKTQREEYKTLIREAQEKSTNTSTYRVVGSPGFWKVKEKINK